MRIPGLYVNAGTGLTMHASGRQIAITNALNTLNTKLELTTGASAWSMSLLLYRQGELVAEYEKFYPGFVANQDFDRFTLRSNSGSTLGPLDITINDDPSIVQILQNDVLVVRPPYGGVSEAFIPVPAVSTDLSGSLPGIYNYSKSITLQNTDAAATVYFNLSGVAASATSGFKLTPGGIITLDAPGGNGFSLMAISTVANSILACHRSSTH